MTSRERLLSIFRGNVPDRPAVRLWGVKPGVELVHPDYEAIYELALERTDLLAHIRPPFELYWGAAAKDICTTTHVPGESADWVDVVTEIRTPQGLLRRVFTESMIGEPGYEKEYLAKTPEDLKKVFSVPYEPLPFSEESFLVLDNAVGNRGLTIFMLDHAAYGLQRLIGPENFAFWSLSHRSVLLEAVEIFA